MNQAVQLNLSTIDGVQTMSSLEMVAFINAYKEGTSEATLQHKTFLAKVPKVLGETVSAEFSAHIQIPGPNGGARQSPIYNFPKREAMLMAMSYSYELQAMVFDAWQAAEAKVVAPAAYSLPSYAEALRLLADNIEVSERQTLQIAQQAVQIEAAAPAVDFVEKYVASEGLRLFRQVAKLLHAPEREFRNFLVDHKYMKKMNGAWVVYDPHLKAGRFEPRERIVDGTARSVVYFTPKGVEYVAKKWNERTPLLRKPLTAPKALGLAASA